MSRSASVRRRQPVLTLEALEDRTVPATFNVTSAADSGTNTLRWAIQQANSTTAADVITFSPSVTAITLDSDLGYIGHNLTIQGPTTGLLKISRNTATGTPNFRLFSNSVGVTTSVSGLELSNFHADWGGAIHNTGTLTINRCWLHDNTSDNDGGAIFQGDSGSLTVTNSTLSANTALYDGGAIHNFGSPVSLTNTTVSANLAQRDGGGIDHEASTLTLVNCTVVNNHCDTNENNSGDGGGIYVVGGTVTLTNTIVAGNRNDNTGSGTAEDIDGAVTATSSFNIIGSSRDLTGISDGVNGNRVGGVSTSTLLNPSLSVLGSNGGSTPTHALLVGSMAIDVGTGPGAPAADQRGQTKAGGNRDIGAFEFVGVTSVSSTQANGTYKAGDVIPITVTFNAPVTVAGTPQLKLETGSSDAVVNYTSGTETLTFNYTVAAGHLSADLNYFNTTALTLNGGTINDSAGGAASLTLPATTAATSLAAQKALAIDAVAPAVTVNKASGQADPTADGTVTFTIVFNEPVTLFTADDVVIGGTALPRTKSLTPIGTDNMTFTLTVGGMTQSGPVTAMVPAGVAIDAVGNLNIASTSTDNSVQFNAPAGATYLVTTTADGGSGSLRLALQQANTSASHDTIMFNLPAGSVISLDSALPDVIYNVAIQGPSDGLQKVQRNTASGTPLFRMLNILSNVTVSLSDLEVRNFNQGGNGGAIFNAGTLTLDDCWLVGNIAGNSSAGGNGGAIYQADTGSLTLTDCTLSDNTGVDGGAIFNLGSPVTLTNSTLSGNSALGNGGAIDTRAGSVGLVNVTVVDNHSDFNLNNIGNGGGLYVAGGSVTLTNTVVADNLNDSLGTDNPSDVQGAVAAASSFNFIGVSTGMTGIGNGTNGNQIGSRSSPLLPALAMLGDFGGPVPVRAPLPGSALINAGTDVGTPASDQRGTPKVGARDLGAVEFLGVTSVSSPAADGSYKVGDSIPITVTFNGSVTVTGTPQLKLETGTSDAVVTYTSGSGTETLTFNYTIAAGHTSADLNYFDVNALTLNGGTIGNGGHANLLLPALNATASLATQKAIVIDTDVPTVALSSTVPAGATNQSPIAVTATFNQAVTGFTADDVAVTNGTVSNFSGSGTTYTFDVTPSGQGLVTVDVAANVAQDTAGNGNTAAVTLSRTFDNQAPTATLTSPGTPTTFSALTPVPVTVSFNEDVTDFTAADLVLANATVANFSGSGDDYHFDLIPTGFGLASVSLAANAAFDAVGNGSGASAALDFTFAAPPPPAPAPVAPVAKATLSAKVARVKGKFELRLTDLVSGAVKVRAKFATKVKLLQQDVNGDGAADFVVTYKKGRKTKRVVYSSVDGSKLA